MASPPGSSSYRERAEGVTLETRRAAAGVQLEDGQKPGEAWEGQKPQRAAAAAGVPESAASAASEGSAAAWSPAAAGGEGLGGCLAAAELPAARQVAGGLMGSFAAMPAAVPAARQPARDWPPWWPEAGLRNRLSRPTDPQLGETVSQL